MFRSIGRFIWKAYEIYCLTIGSLVVLYIPFATAMMLLKFDFAYLPNGVRIAHPSIFSGFYETTLWRPNGGGRIYDGYVDLICFNDDYIYATTYEEKYFIYSVREDKLVTVSRRETPSQEYMDIERASRLFHPETHNCDGYFKGLMGLTLFLHDSSLLRDLKKELENKKKNDKTSDF